MENLPEMLNWKYGSVADTFGDKITAWRHPTLPQPDEKQIIKDLAEYDAALPTIEQAKQADIIANEQRKVELLEKLGLSTDDVELLKEILT